MRMLSLTGEKECHRNIDNVVVKKGITIGVLVTLFLFVGLYFIAPKFDEEVALVYRIKLGYSRLAIMINAFPHV